MSIVLFILWQVFMLAFIFTKRQNDDLKIKLGAYEFDEQERRKARHARRWGIRSIGSILCILALATFAAASNCHVQRILIPSRHVAPIIAIQDHHDYDYRVRYNPSGDQLEAFKLFIEKYDARTDQLIQALKVASGTGGALLPLKAEALKAKHHPAQAACVTCHDSTNYKTAGGDEKFYEAGVLIDNPENINRMYEAVIKKKSMPRRVTWGAQERLDWVDSIMVKTVDAPAVVAPTTDADGPRAKYKGIEIIPPGAPR